MDQNGIMLFIVRMVKYVGRVLTRSSLLNQNSVLPLPHEAREAQGQTLLGVYQTTSSHVLGRNSDVLGTTQTRHLHQPYYKT